MAQSGAEVVRFDSDSTGGDAVRARLVAVSGRFRMGLRSGWSDLAQKADARRRPIALVLLVVVVSLALMPVLRSNQLAPADPAFFANWQQDSENLVLSKIESTTPRAPSSDTAAFGLVSSAPDPWAPDARFNQLRDGATPTTGHYVAYPAQLGVQGFLFTGLYDLGLRTQSALWTVSSALTALALVTFGLVLARIGRPSLGVVFVIVAAMSPWITSAARNLYWVPWTWFLPACVAAAWVASDGRRRRVLGVVMFLTFALRFACGFEFLTCITLLAAAVPLIAHVFNRVPGSRGRALRDSGRILLTAVGAFVVIAVLVVFVAGRGNPLDGLQEMVYDVAKRTYGGVKITDPALAPSLSASPITVLGMYFLGWPTPVVSMSFGWPLTVTFTGAAFWLLAVGGAVAPLVRLLRADRRWRRDGVLLTVSLAVPLSWIILAKSHAYAHPHIDFVLWYLISVSTLLWLIGSFVTDAIAGAARVRADRAHAVIAPSAHVGRA